MDMDIVKNIVFNHPLEQLLWTLQKGFHLESIRDQAWKFSYNRCVKEIELKGLTPPHGKVYMELVNEYERQQKNKEQK